MRVILENLAAKLGHEIVQYHSPYVWLYHGQNPAVILKIEETKNDDKVFVNASFARDGSGPLLASFMSMLLIEDSHATVADTIGVCSGYASVTLYHMLDISQLDEARLMHYLHNFEALALCIFEQASGQPDHSLPTHVPLPRSEAV